MTMKSTKFPSRLPTLSQLLDRPQVRVLKSRLSQAAVASGARSFLDQLKQEIQQRTDMRLPSMGELAEQAARHILGIQQRSTKGVINATGRASSDTWSGLPLGDAAQQALIEVTSRFVARDEGLRAESDDLLARVTGAEDALALHSYAGALWLTLSTLGQGREVVVARGQLGELESHQSLVELISSSGAQLKEVGTTNRVALADYETALSERTGAILVVHSDRYGVVGCAATAEVDALVGLARDREIVLIEALDGAPLTDDLPGASISDESRSAAEAVACGADVVILRGDGLAAGPACGLMVGREQYLDAIRRNPLAATWRLDSLRGAVLAATLASLGDDSAARQAIPVWRLLQTPVDNLRNRAERLATQLTLAPHIAAADPVPTESWLDDRGAAGRVLESYGVSLAPADGDVAGLDGRLRQAPLPVHGRVESDRLVLDLRTVLPDQDQRIIEAILGPSEDQESNPPADSPVMD